MALDGIDKWSPPVLAPAHPILAWLADRVTPSMTMGTLNKVSARGSAVVGLGWLGPLVDAGHARFYDVVITGEWGRAGADPRPLGGCG